MLELLWLACTGKTPDTAGGTDTADSTADTSDSTDTGDTADTVDTADTGESAETGESGDTGEPPIPDERIVLYSADPIATATLAWADWLSASGTVESWAWDDEGAPLPTRDALVVLSPDLPESAGERIGMLASHGGPVLAIGVGGARAYDGLDLGMGATVGIQTTADGLVVATGQAGHPIYAGVSVPKDGALDVWPEAVNLIGIEPTEAMEVLGWDNRYPDSVAVLLHVDRFWYWGWGGVSYGYPQDTTPDGDAVLRALVNSTLQ